ncbi:nucleolar gtp-binding protein [Perkinsus olseni]|uniref:Nucleolar GTP-binding protein 2 n=4 Tax=Perkinsus olseni TaxID=32597 RepID=A0A7J6L0V3_PEROL|nr:nucleolar gtp-binding protein [Perkinsus olseni]
MAKQTRNKGLGGAKSRTQGKAFNPGNASTNPDRKTASNAPGFMRSKNTINRLNMYSQKLKKADLNKRKIQPTGPARIAPDRRWFGNTRVLSQQKLQKFREEIGQSVNDPFQVVLKSSKLPMSLLTEGQNESDQPRGKAARKNLLAVEPFDKTFGSAKTRKRPRLSTGSMEEMANKASRMAEEYDPSKDKSSEENRVLRDEEHTVVNEEVFKKGTSRRIWQELYKVVDSSDVILEVIDARDPMGTRCQKLEREIRKTRPNKHIVLILNKCDLIPTWATKRWVQVLSKEFPTLAFHASVTNPFGKSALFQLLRQFAQLLKERKHVSIGMIGYPNVGKSSVINALKRKKVCKAAPVPGETKVWQYVALTKRIYLIDCPGIVPATSDDFKQDCAKILKGVVRPERVENPSNYIDEVLSRAKREDLITKYSLPNDFEWADGDDFLTKIAQQMGKLRKGGEADIETAARIVLYDWQKGRIPYFELPPKDGEDDQEDDEEEEEEEEVNVTEGDDGKQTITIHQDLSSIDEALEGSVGEEATLEGEGEEEPSAPAKRTTAATAAEAATAAAEEVDWDKLQEDFDQEE